MRYISTNNGQVSFVEVNDQNVILSSRSFAFGSMYYTIKNNKITFYSVDSETPYRSDLWTVNIPVTIDDVVYSTAEDATGALGKIFDNGLTEKVDELEQQYASQQQELEDLDDDITALSDDIDAEVTRAYSAETALHDEIGAESTRAQLAEQANADAITAESNRAQVAESGLTSAINAEIARAQSAETANANAIAAEVNRAQSAETVNADAISAEVTRAQTAESGLQTSIASEISRAQSAETEIHNEISAERTRALNAESALSESINAEVTRATAKDASQDALISGLNTSLTAEINRATGAENGLRSDLNAEVSARSTADAAQLQRITAVEISKADANSVYTKTESDGKYATKDYVSGLTDNFYTKSQTNELLADEASARTAGDQAVSAAVDTALIAYINGAEYVSTAKTINFLNGQTVIDSIDATDFIKDGMVSNVQISGGSLVIEFNTDAGKEDIVIPLTSIFDPNNYYNKSQVDGIVSGKTNQADFSGHTANTTVHVTSSEKQTWNNKSDFSGSYNDLTDKPTIPSLDGYATQSWVSGFTYDKNTIDEKVAQGGTFDPTLYYKKSETSGATELSTAFSNKLDATAYTPTDLSNYYQKSETSGKTELSTAFSNKLDATAYTPTDLSNYYQKSETSGKTELSSAFTNKQDVLVSGVSIKTINSQSLLGQGNIDIQGGGSSITVVQTTGSSTGDVMSQSAVTASLGDKADSSALTAHTANTTVHVSASEKQTWNAKSDFSGSYNDLTNKPTIPTIWTGTQAQFDQILVKDPNTIYLVQ